MPGFEFDHRTGMMVQKKDDQIYFAGSMGGGLRIDDRKNKVTYIIERDGRITNIAGIKDDKVNLYDMRDARIIADRVVRMFGRNHKYSDFHYFLKGYVMKEGVIKTYGEFINESVIDDILTRNKQGAPKIESGAKKLCNAPDGKVIIVSADFGEIGDLVTWGDNEYVYVFDDVEDLNLICVSDNDTDYFLRFFPDAEPGEINAEFYFDVETDLRKDEFKPLIAVLRAGDDIEADILKDLDVDYRYESILFSMGNAMEYLVFWDSDAAWRYAIDDLKDSLCDYTDDKEIERFHKLFGDNIFNASDIEEAMRESYEYQFDDMDEEDALSALIDKNIIDESEEFFELDDNGEIDLTSPKFDYTKYKDDYVDAMIEDIDLVNEMLINYGYDELLHYIDYEELAKCIIDSDGVASVIASYDGVEGEEDVDGTTYYIYRTN